MNTEVRSAIAPLAQLADDYRIAIIMISHMSKGGGGRAMYARWEAWRSSPRRARRTSS